MGYVYKDMERLRFWCQKVLPTVYDDSLSYYELLTKVVQYLNDTVENVNTLIQQVADIDTDLSRVAIIDDNVISADYTWSSQKSNSMMNSKITDAIRNTSAPNNTGNTYSCKYITDHFSNVIEGISVNGSTVSPDAQKVVNLVVMTNAVNDLVNYYLKTETYSKVEVNTLLENIRNSSFEIVDSLPVSDIKTNVIYLVPKGSGRTGYYEWVYLNVSGTYQWEEIGDTDIDLSGYVTTQSLNATLANYVTNTVFQTLVSTVNGKVDKDTFGGVLGSDGNKINLEENISLFISSQTGDINLRTDTTDIISEGSMGIPTSRAVATTLKSFFPRSEQAVLGAKNLCPNIATTKTDSDVTFTVNSDGSVTLNGTASANIGFELKGYGKWLKPNVNYILNGCTGGSDNTYKLAVNKSTGDIAKCLNGDVEFSVDNTADYRVWIVVYAGTQFNNLTIYPMIRLASDPDDTYVPYAMTNRELTEKTNEFDNFNMSKTVYGSGTYKDLNDVTTSGMYSVWGSALNKPSDIVQMQDATLIVTNNPIGTQITQTLINGTEHSIYTRVYANNVWGNWYKFTGTVVS